MVISYYYADCFNEIAPFWIYMYKILKNEVKTQIKRLAKLQDNECLIPYTLMVLVLELKKYFK